MAYELIGITVSVHCTSVLSLALPINLHQFSKWYIITDSDDTETIRMCRDYETTNLELITFNFFHQATFNKGGGIRAAQEIAHKVHPEASILILDTDIILPVNLGEVLQNLAFDEKTLFGASGRFDYPSVTALLANEYQEYKYGQSFTGFFQLYTDKKKYYQPSESIDQCDDDFRDSFADRRAIDKLFLRHLGTSGYGIRYLEQHDREKWDGKNSRPQFDMDRPVNSLDLQYSV